MAPRKKNLKEKSYQQKLKFQNPGHIKTNLTIWCTDTIMLNLKNVSKMSAPFPRVCFCRIWAQLIALVKLYMLVPFLVSKYNHFIIKYDFPQH